MGVLAHAGGRLFYLGGYSSSGASTPVHDVHEMRMDLSGWDVRPEMATEKDLRFTAHFVH